MVRVRLALLGWTAEAAVPTQFGWAPRLRSGRANEAAVPTQFGMVA
jgi:hypothetical protein